MTIQNPSIQTIATETDLAVGLSLTVPRSLRTRIKRAAISLDLTMRQLVMRAVTEMVEQTEAHSHPPAKGGGRTSQSPER
jgi:hypothetical protein